MKTAGTKALRHPQYRSVRLSYVSQSAFPVSLRSQKCRSSIRDGIPFLHSFGRKYIKSDNLIL